MTVDQALKEAVADAVAPLRDELARQRIALDRLLGRLPVWISLDQAAEQLGVSRRSVERAVAAGEIRAKHLGRRVLVDLTETGEELRGRTGKDAE